MTETRMALDPKRYLNILRAFREEAGKASGNTNIPLAKVTLLAREKAFMDAIATFEETEPDAFVAAIRSLREAERAMSNVRELPMNAKLHEARAQAFDDAIRVFERGITGSTPDPEPEIEERPNE